MPGIHLIFSAQFEYQTVEEGVTLSLEFIPPEGMEVDDVVLHFLKLRALFHQRAEWTI